jgi:hypothetical protein
MTGSWVGEVLSSVPSLYVPSLPPKRTLHPARDEDMDTGQPVRDTARYSGPASFVSNMLCEYGSGK